MADVPDKELQAVLRLPAEKRYAHFMNERKVRILIVVAVWIAVACGCSLPVSREQPGVRKRGQCSTDSDCGRRLCVHGRCVECESNEHCGDRCRICGPDLRCRPVANCCYSDAGCPIGRCEWDHEVHHGTCRKQCDRDATCPTGFVCRDAVCVPSEANLRKWARFPYCRIDRDCRLGYSGAERCIAGYCRRCSPGERPCGGDPCGRCDAGFECRHVAGCCLMDRQCSTGLCAFTKGVTAGRCQLRRCFKRSECSKGQICRAGRCVPTR